MKEMTLILFLMGLYYLFAFCIKKREFKFLKKKWDHQKYFSESLRLYRNALIRFGIEAFLPIMVAILIEFKSASFSTGFKAFSFFMALFALFGLASLFVANIYLLAKHKKHIMMNTED